MNAVDPDVVEVIEGLYPGERVVSEGNYSLQYLAPVAEAESEDADPVSAGEGEAHAHAERAFPPAIVWALGVLGALVVAVLGVRILRARARPAPEAR